MRTLLLLLLPLLACADDPPPAAPLDPGTFGAASSQIRVRVIDARTRAPIARAAVGSGDFVVGTDATGEAIVPRGDAIVAVGAEGFVAQTFVGAEAGALTFALEPITAPTARTVTVELAEWSALRASEGDGLVARFSAGRDPRIDREAPGTATCVGTDTECRVTFAVGEHARHAFAELAVIDDAGTPEDPSDDVETPFGFAIGELVDDGATLARVDAVVEVELDLRLPTGIDAIVGVPGVRIDDEVLVLAPANRDRFVLPVIDGAAFWAIATSTTGELTTRSVERATADELRGSFVPPAPLTGLEVRREGDALVLDHEAALLVLASREHVVHVFDERTQVPVAWFTSEVTAIDTEATRGPEGWNLDEVERRWTRRAIRSVP
ncbi:MAG: hypothetical protein MUE69_04615 [Myxococcota bacterium]|jgi:hypothetical protein|nr:hypothetical protein [Myxococcota bacterium]